MEIKDMKFLSVRNIGINFFGSLVVSQNAVKWLNNFPNMGKNCGRKSNSWYDRRRVTMYGT